MTEEYPYYDNLFKVCSDEWADRSLINSLISNLSFDIENKEDTIKDYTGYIQKDIDNGFYPNICCTRVEEYIKRYKEHVYRLKMELIVLKSESLSDKEKLSRYNRVKEMGF